MRTRVGYAGGTKDQPTYRDMGDHTEAIRVVYDPQRISYGALLTVFWDSHDPVYEPWSRQYRSAIFPSGAEQRKLAEVSKAARREVRARPIYTAIEDGATFWTAEDYHQKYRLRSEPLLIDALVKRYPDGGWIDSTAAARVNGLLGGHGISEPVSALGLPDPAVALLAEHAAR